MKIEIQPLWPKSMKIAIQPLWPKSMRASNSHLDLSLLLNQT